MRPVHFFTAEYLEQCRQMTPDQIIRFVDDFRRLHGGATRRDAPAKSRLISLEVPRGPARCVQDQGPPERPSLPDPDQGPDEAVDCRRLPGNGPVEQACPRARRPPVDCLCSSGTVPAAAPGTVPACPVHWTGTTLREPGLRRDGSLAQETSRRCPRLSRRGRSAVPRPLRRCRP